MSSFSDTLKKLRIQHGLSQQQLAGKLFVDRSSIAHWESGRRVPDAVVISRLARYFNVDMAMLIDSAAHENAPNVIVVDDEQILLSGAMSILGDVMQGAAIVGFTKPSEAIEFAGGNRVDIAFLDIELGQMSGLDLCKSLMDIHPLTNVIFLTGYENYSLDAWNTGACGFLLKPLSAEAVRSQLKRLRTPVGLGELS